MLDRRQHNAGAVVHRTGDVDQGIDCPRAHQQGRVAGDRWFAGAQAAFQRSQVAGRHGSVAAGEGVGIRRPLQGAVGDRHHLHARDLVGDQSH